MRSTPNQHSVIDILPMCSIKSTKTDAGNHGVGLSSVYRIAAKYHGVVTIDDGVTNRFLIRVVLYGKQK